MKKKVFALSLALGALALILSAGTLAYFSDTDTATNTFTLGKVEIELKETDHEGNDFVQNQKLVPGSSTVDAIAKNAFVTVEDGSEDAWVWVEMLIPSELYNSKDEHHESNNALHYNQFVNYLQGYTSNSTNPGAVTLSGRIPADHQWSLMKYIEEREVDGKNYSVLRTTHKDIVSAGTTTSPAVSQIYMDDDVKYQDGKYYIPTDQTATEFVEYDGDWKVIINAYAVQADGIADVDAAVAAYNK